MCLEKILFTSLSNVSNNVTLDLIKNMNGFSPTDFQKQIQAIQFVADNILNRIEKNDWVFGGGTALAIEHLYELDKQLNNHNQKAFVADMRIVAPYPPYDSMIGNVQLFLKQSIAEAKNRFLN